MARVIETESKVEILGVEGNSRKVGEPLGVLVVSEHKVRKDLAVITVDNPDHKVHAIIIEVEALKKALDNAQNAHRY